VPATTAALVIAPLDGGAGTAVRWNDRAAMNPASAMKLVTTYAALNLLGPDHTWRTDVLARGPLKGDTLQGDLAIRASGDPKIVIEQLWLLAYRVRAYGIRDVSGDIWVDKRVFAPVNFDPNEFDGEGSRAYNVGPDALLLNFKALAFHFVPDPSTQTARVVVVPAVAGMREPKVVSGSTQSCGDWRGKLRADFSNPFTPTFSGTYPLACGERVWYVSALDHAEYFEAIFRALWTQVGGSWRGRLRLGPTAADARVVASHESPPLALAIRDVNKFSNNVMARHLLLATAADPAMAVPASTEKGVAVIRAWLARERLDGPELVLENGSGLSRRERISAGTMARLLTHAHRSPLSAEFVASLPISGIDGTLKDRDIARGAAHLKTGLLQDARSLAGFVTSRSGKRYVLVSFLNHPNANSWAAQRAQDALVNWLVETG
jgi:D-alanyl-D-alanine carboxypeptidase/D-alanyl-D-alanine-endopeptidase (penicillin-binding protein 4)